MRVGNRCRRLRCSGGVQVGEEATSPTERRTSAGHASSGLDGGITVPVRLEPFFVPSHGSRCLFPAFQREDMKSVRTWKNVMTCIASEAMAARIASQPELAPDHPFEPFFPTADHNAFASGLGLAPECISSNFPIKTSLQDRQILGARLLPSVETLGYCLAVPTGRTARGQREDRGQLHALRSTVRGLRCPNATVAEPDHFAGAGKMMVGRTPAGHVLHRPARAAGITVCASRPLRSEPRIALSVSRTV